MFKTSFIFAGVLALLSSPSFQAADPIAQKEGNLRKLPAVVERGLTYTSCESCTAIEGLGWCFDSIANPEYSNCQEGFQTDSTAGGCQYWAFESDRCPSGRVASNDDCTTCAATDGAGWCYLDKKCYYGDESGPFAGSCLLGGWVYNDGEEACQRF